MSAARAELLTTLGESLGCHPTPRAVPPLPDRLYYDGPPLVDHLIWVDPQDRRRWIIPDRSRRPQCTQK
jgi:hypothetical protein